MSLHLAHQMRVYALPRCCQGRSSAPWHTRRMSSMLVLAAAQVTRDRLMLELDKQDPQYGFAQHKVRAWRNKWP